jgi:o-succinylbenzoate synthase
MIGTRPVVLLEGPAGWGEWSPLPGYPCDPARAREAALEAACTGWPAPRRDTVPVNALVDGPGFDAEALRSFPAVKVKVRSLRDVDLVAAVRDAVGPSARVRIDANGTFDVDGAVALLTSLEPYDLELAEQPVATIDELAELRRRVRVPLAADECVRTIDDARRLRRLGAADVLVCKVQPLGGVRAALDVVAEADVPAVVTSMHETSVGLAAGLALAAALPELRYACGLATAPLLPADVTRDPLLPDAGWLRVRRVTPDPALLEALAGGVRSSS